MYRRVHQLAWKIRPWIDPSINVNELTASIIVDFFDKAAFAMQMADDNLRYLAPPVPRALPPPDLAASSDPVKPRKALDARYQLKGLLPR